MTGPEGYDSKGQKDFQEGNAYKAGEKPEKENVREREEAGLEAARKRLARRLEEQKKPPAETGKAVEEGK